MAQLKIYIENEDNKLCNEMSGLPCEKHCEASTLGSLPNVCNFFTCNEQGSSQEPRVNIETICNHLQKSQGDNTLGDDIEVTVQDLTEHSVENTGEVKQCGLGSINGSTHEPRISTHSLLIMP